MEKLRNRHVGLIDNTSLDFQRYLINRLPWERQLIGIKGSRGVGKTTMILQYIKSRYQQSEKAIYVSLDDMYFAENSLLEFADEFVSKGGEHLFVDEVHKYPNWSVELKNIYDYHPKLRVVFTGSSLLEILNSRADLSRRALVFNLQGLSFREFLLFRHNIRTDSLSFEDVLSNHTEIALDISNKFKPLAYFDEYLKTGYFPFFDGNRSLYYKQLQEVVNMILEIELPLLRNTDISIVSKIKQLLLIISRSVPFKPNISSIADKVNVTRKTILDYITYLNDAGILSLIYKDSHGVSLLQKPEKIYLDNTNLAYMLADDTPNIGNIRETFFLNQVSQNHDVGYSEKGDFFVDNKYTFEIGGKNKTNKQIMDIPDAYRVVDNIEYGYDKTIPLWLFGFLY
ncbi:MAG: ATP-binding protein [Bacteroidales bacterium]|nr:ATP-binding protein [Bacteroidales bacterium]